jgi:hypothetical protein
MTTPRAYRPQNCPRCDRCSANVCPLDAEWRKRTHVRGDEVCFFLTESVKVDAAGNFASLGLGWLLDRANHVRDDIALPDGIKTTVERARLTGSRIVNQRIAADRLRRQVVR